MDKLDGRKLPPEAQHERRRLAVKLYRQGLSFDQVSATLDMGHVTVRKCVRTADQFGMAALKPKKVGRPVGHKRTLSIEQERMIRQTIVDKRPEQLKFGFALWTRGAVQQLILQECGISMPIRTVGLYLQRWGFTPQKPIVRAYEQSPQAVQKWLEEDYPQIAAQAKQEGAEIHWGDETALVNTDVRGRGFQPKGQTPVAYAVAGKRERLSMISTVTNQGKVRWMIVEENFKAEKFIEFMEHLIKDSERKIYLIVDNLRVHHSKAVKAWEEEHADKIALYYLPSYSPELNPDERLNADLKYAVGSQIAQRSKKGMKEVTTKHMEKLKATPERVKSYFQDKRIKYAA